MPASLYLVKNTQALFACSEREAREAIALNYRSISMIDDGVGRLLAELTRLGQATRELCRKTKGRLVAGPRLLTRESLGSPRPRS